jgi:hypothetical protein
VAAGAGGVAIGGDVTGNVTIITGHGNVVRAGSSQVDVSQEEGE